MLGRLPVRHRVTIWIAGLLVCAGTGAWAALMTPIPLMWSSGAVIGALVGVVIVAGYLAVLEGGGSDSRDPAEPRA